MRKSHMFSFIRNKGNLFRRRSVTKAAKNLGVIEIELGKNDKRFRDPKLEYFDAYYENRQYEHLTDWEDALMSDVYVPVRSRCPRIRYPFAKTLSDRLIAMMMGKNRFPAFIVEDNPDDQEFIRTVVKASQMQAKIMEPLRRMVNTGSVFIRFHIIAGVIKLEWFHAKYCYPTFQENGQLESVEIKYVFVDKTELDADGNFKVKWFKMFLGRDFEIMYDSPEFDENDPEEPTFTEIDRVEHGLGFVQGVWPKTGDQRGNPDGPALVADLTDFIDELCYSLSQSSQAVSYNQDPQLVINNMTEQEMAELIRSATKSWNLGKEGKAEFLEPGMSGVETAMELRDKVKQNVGEIARILLLDPEKIVGSAQSAKAMEVLHGPMVDLVNELRLVVEPYIKELVTKMCVATLQSSELGIDAPIVMPDDFTPESLAFELKWKPIFEQTIEDLAKKVAAGSAAVMGRGISEETFTKFIAEDFGVEDVKAERAAIDAKPPPNPFGGF